VTTTTTTTTQGYGTTQGYASQGYDIQEAQEVSANIQAQEVSTTPFWEKDHGAGVTDDQWELLTDLQFQKATCVTGIEGVPAHKFCIKRYNRLQNKEIDLDRFCHACDPEEVANKHFQKARYHRKFKRFCGECCHAMCGITRTTGLDTDPDTTTPRIPKLGGSKFADVATVGSDDENFAVGGFADVTTTGPLPVLRR